MPEPLGAGGDGARHGGLRLTRAAEPQIDPGAFFDDAPCGFLVVGPDWRIGRANRTLGDWIGAEPGTLEGRHLRDLLDVAGRIFFDTHFAPLVRLQGAFHEVALNLRRADGSRMATLVNAVERHGPDGAIEAMLVTVFNATDRRRYEEELLEARDALRALTGELEARVEAEVEARLAAESTLRQAQKMEAIGNLSGGIAHDFNNILQIVSANLGFLSKRVSGDGATFVANAQAGVERGARLAQQLLDIGRRKPVEAALVDAVSVVGGMRDLLGRTLGSSAHLAFDLPDEPMVAMVDASQLENAVLNLCINARDAMTETPGGELRVAVRGDGKAPADLAGAQVEIRVTDAGAGMDEATAAKVFEPFFTTKPAGRGTGLGLAMVYGFARQSGGGVTIHSTPGVGTSVSIWLPRSAEAPASASGAVPAEVRGGTETVLVVEDDETVREATCAMLADLGYAVLPAATGAEARAHLDGDVRIDLTVLDLILRGSQEGMALVREFADGAHRGALLLTSGQADEFDERLDRSVELLRKPYDRLALAAAVRRAIGTPGRTETAEPRPALGPLPAASPAEALRVLLVEDEFLICMTAAEQLQDLGHVPVEAADAERAIGILEGGGIDVLMTDIGLPGMDGGALARAARRMDPSIGVVFATGADELPLLDGAPGVRLGKPYSDEQLSSALAAARAHR